MESRIDQDGATVSCGGTLTVVNPCPISIEWPGLLLSQAPPVETCRTPLPVTQGCPHGHRLGVGVEWVDYTKGIRERFWAVERLLEFQPEWIGRFSFLQVVAPS